MNPPSDTVEGGSQLRYRAAMASARLIGEHLREWRQRRRMSQLDLASDAVMQEPVYNVDVAWPDRASMIRAHDLGPERDGELFRYYAAVSPNRLVYRFDRRTGQVQELGRVGDLGKAATP